MKSFNVRHIQHHLAAIHTRNRSLLDVPRSGGAGGSSSKVDLDPPALYEDVRAASAAVRSRGRPPPHRLAPRIRRSVDAACFGAPTQYVGQSAHRAGRRCCSRSWSSLPRRNNSSCPMNPARRRRRSPATASILRCNLASCACRSSSAAGSRRADTACSPFSSTRDERVADLLEDEAVELVGADIALWATTCSPPALSGSWLRQ